MELSFVNKKGLSLGLLMLMLLSLAACGVKGPVKPPRAHLPEAPGNLALAQTDSYFLISWTIPKTNEDGSPLEDLQGFDIYKTGYDPNSGCPGCNESQEVFRHLDLEYLRQASRKGEIIFFRDFDLEPDFGYRYKVVPFNRKGQLGNSATNQRAFLIAPPPPENLQIGIGDDTSTLTWSVRTTEKPEAGFLGYNIYRQEGDAPSPLNPVNEDYWADNSYTDRALEKGKAYIYTLRSVWRLQGLIVESADSNPVSTVLPKID